MRVRASANTRVGQPMRLVGGAMRTAWAADRRGTAVAGLLQMLTGLSALGVVAASKLALDGILDEDGGSGVTGLALGLTLLAGATALTSVGAVLQGQHQRVVGERVVQRLWQSLLRVCAGVDLVTWESTEFMARLDRVQENSLGRPSAVMSAAFSAIGAVFAVLGMLAALLLIHPVLLPVLFLAGVPTLLLSRAASRSEFRFASRSNQTIRLRNYIKVLLISRPFAAEIRAFQSGSHFTDRHDAYDTEYLGELRAQVQRRQVLGLASAATSAVALAVTLVLIVVLVDTDRISLAQAGAAAIAARLLAGQLGSVFSALSTIIEAGPFLADLESFLHTEAEPDDRTSTAHELHTEVRAEQVSFSYPGSSKPAVDGVTISVGRGQVVALVGENGSGKTTLAKIVAGLYEPSTGSVTWDGAVLRPADLRASVTVLFQDFVRYHLSALENITISDTRRNADRDWAVRAARRSDVDSALAQLPSGYDTVLGAEMEEGSDLSGGQWQRLALARALYRDLPLVVLDEPTAAMDPRAEHELFADVRAMLQGRAALLISHRYSSVRLADWIYVMDQGHVAESGTHDDLLRARGRYAELYSLQAAAFLDGAARDSAT